MLHLFVAVQFVYLWMRKRKLKVYLRKHLLKMDRYLHVKQKWLLENFIFFFRVRPLAYRVSVTGAYHWNFECWKCFFLPKKFVSTQLTLNGQQSAYAYGQTLSSFAFFFQFKRVQEIIKNQHNFQLCVNVRDKRTKQIIK